MKIDWAKKLGSRKFWAAVLALVGTLCVLFGCDELGTEKVCAMVSACGVLAVYIFTEGYIDSKYDNDDNDTKQ